GNTMNSSRHLLAAARQALSHWLGRGALGLAMSTVLLATSCSQGASPSTPASASSAASSQAAAPSAAGASTVSASPQPAAASSAGASSPSASPRRGGDLTIVESVFNWATLDPAGPVGSPLPGLYYAVFDPLLRVTADNKLEPW